MTTFKIKDGKTLEQFLKVVAEESVSKALGKLKVQNGQIIKEEDDIFGNKEPPQQEQQPKQTTSVSQEIPHTITLDAIVNKLNVIRSGKSLKKDDLVQGELTDYFNKLNDEEKKSLYAFLKSIGAIMGGSVDGENVPSPKEIGSLFPKGQQKQQQPIQQAEKPQNKVVVNTSSVSREDNAPPIRVRRSANESITKDIKKIIS